MEFVLYSTRCHDNPTWFSAPELHIFHLETECRLFPPVTIFRVLVTFSMLYTETSETSKKLIYLDLSGRFSKR